MEKDSRTEFLQQKGNEFVFVFGKFKNKPLSQVAQTNPGFLKWVLMKFDTIPETQKLAIEQALDDSASSFSDD